MKKYTLFFLIAILQLTTDRAFGQVASLVLSDPVASNNLTHFFVTDPNNEPYTIQTTIGGMQCRQIPGSKYGYFHANDAAISSAENNLIFEITYYDSGTDELAFQYNATSAVNYKHVGIKKTGTNTWITATIALTDASLRNAQNNAADFRIGTTTGYNNYIREITISLGTLDPASESVPTTSGSVYSEFIGKSVAGYQVWFNTGTAGSGWFHWSNGPQPAVGNLKFEVYPDVTEYDDADLTQTGFANLGNESASKLFHSSNTNVINKHFEWMEEEGIDGVALQRFINGIGPVIAPSPAASPLKVKTAAEATNRIFYICYDITSVGFDATWDEIIKFDWVYNIEQAYALTSSPAYATVNNKPVVQLWGTGFTGNPGTEQETIDLINFLKSRGCYVIGGLPTHWRTESGDSKSDFLDAYKTFDMISPWSVGRFGDVAGANNFKTNQLIPDKVLTDAEGIDYMPVLFPGFSWSQWKNGEPNMMERLAGDFLWKQAVNIEDIGVSNMYFAMFDEYDEGTAIMKAATDYSMIPTDQYFVTLSADGIWTSSDFYLRLAGAATEMLKGTRAVTADVPIAYSEGPVYYRNSFEKRFATYDNGSGYFNIDPCFYNDGVVSSTNMSGTSVVIENNATYSKTGLFATKITGTNAAANAEYSYKVSATKIPVKANMHLSFWKYAVNAQGQNTVVDLLFQSGKRLSALSAYVDNNGYAMSPSIARGTVGAWQNFTCQIGTGELIGDVLTGIIISYSNTSASGTFTAYFDDIVIEDALATTPIQSVYGGTVWPIPGKIEAENYDYGGEGIAYHDFEVENKFNQFRTGEGVDVETCGDDGAGYNVGWIETGEWLEYTVNVQTTGIYRVEARVASANAGTKTIHVELDGTDISGAMSFDATVGWQTYQTINATTPAITTGEKIMRVYIDAGGFNLNHITFVLETPLGIFNGGNNGVTNNDPQMAAIQVYPNPLKTANPVYVQLGGEETDSYQVRLYSYIGTNVFSGEIQAIEKNGIYMLPIPQQLVAGHYQLELISANGKRTMRKLIIY